MIDDRITVVYDPPPIPPRQFDYCATLANYSGEPGDPRGYGATRHAATLDLLMQIDLPTPVTP